MHVAPDFSPAELHEWRETLAARGWVYVERFQVPPDGGIRALALARLLGQVVVYPGMDPHAPVLATATSHTAPSIEPFNRPETLDWHNDFTTHRCRPRLSLAFLQAQSSPRCSGHWEVAAAGTVIAALSKHAEHLRMLRCRTPYSFSDGGPLQFFKPLGRRGLRFWGRAMRDGALSHYGYLPAPLAAAITFVEDAASTHGVTLPTPVGSLLIVDNYRALHKRADALPGRSSILMFARSARFGADHGKP